MENATSSLGISVVADNFCDSQLKSQRLIKIYIGDASEPYLMSETTLTAASDYFAKALKHEGSLGPSDLGVLRFPDDGDSQEAWGLLLFWIVMKRLPDEYTLRGDDQPDPEVVETWIRTWVLADKYLLPKLQDGVMLEMLFHLQQSLLATCVEDAEMVNSMLRISPVDSPLRRLVAEETVRSMFEPRSGAYEELTAEHLNCVNEGLGVTDSLLSACRDFTQNKGEYLRSENGDGDVKCALWKEHLVGDLPGLHWVVEHMSGIYSVD